MMKNRITVFGITVIGLMILSSSFYSVESTSENPPVNCSMDLLEVNDSTFVVQNYTGTFTVENKILTGTPLVSTSNDTIRVSGANYSTVIMVSDDNGCFTHQTINKY